MKRANIRKTQQSQGKGANTMKKFNRSEIMRNASAYRKANGLNRSDALRAAWLNAKTGRLDTRICALSYADSFTASERKLNGELRSERNSLASKFASLVPPVMSERDRLLNQRFDMTEDARRNSDYVTYYRLKDMSIGEFADYVSEMAKVA